MAYVGMPLSRAIKNHVEAFEALAAIVAEHKIFPDRIHAHVEQISGPDEDDTSVDDAERVYEYGFNFDLVDQDVEYLEQLGRDRGEPVLFRGPHDIMMLSLALPGMRFSNCASAG